MLIHGHHLFPLRTLSQNIGTAYFLSVDGKVYSNRTGTLVELKGSRTTSGTYFKFGSQYGSGWKLDDVVKLAKAHKTWTKETTAPEVAVDVPANRSHAPTAELGVKAKGTIIGRLHKGRLVFGHDPKVHLTEVSVNDEMTRLASMHQGVKFVALKITKSVVSGGVVWE